MAPPSGPLSFGTFDGRYSPVAEWLAISDEIDVGRTAIAECGTMQVPANWSEPDGDSIEVFVKRYLAAEQPAEAQLWMLEGGPGLPGSTMEHSAFIIGSQNPTLDIYLPDHRGTGRSTFAQCPDDLTTEDCAASVPHLDGLTVTGAAQDLAALIDATRTELQQTIVYGDSYGTFWAQRYLQVRPEQPTAVILDSVAPIGIDLAEFDMGFDEKARAVVEICETDAACSAKVGPVPLATVEQAITGYAQACTIYASNLRFVFGDFLAGGDYFARLLLPPIAYRVLRCSEADLVWLDKVYGYLGWRGTRNSNGYSDVVFTNIATSEFWLSDKTATEARADAETLIATTGLPESLAGRASVWPRYPRDEYFGKWPSSDAHILLLQGGLDARTPYGDIVEQHYSGENQHYVEMPTATHAVLFPLASPTSDLTAAGCGYQIIQSFLSDPTRAPDTSCIAGMMPIDFGNPPAEWMSLVGIQDLWEGP
jgi:pimeloyl-ACP methyl ester carboxylesterase